MLTAAQQDYVEVIYRLEMEHGESGVRISQIADALGTRLPTVTRTVQKLAALEIVAHDARREVRLTDKGKQIGGEIVHRHEDLVRFFTDVLGLDQSVAERDTCQIEHGFSGRASQRLHEFLEHFLALRESKKRVVTEFLRSASPTNEEFANLPRRRTGGWRS